MKTKWPFNLKQTLAGIQNFVLLVIAVVTFYNYIRLTELDKKIEVDFDYEIILNSSIDINEDTENDFVIIYFPIQLKIANLSTKGKISIEGIRSLLLFPKNYRNLSLLDNNVIFKSESNKQVFPIYLNNGEQKFLFPVVAWPIKKGNFIKFKKAFPDDYKKYTLAKYIESFSDDFEVPYLTLVVESPKGDLASIQFNFKNYFDNYQTREFLRRQGVR
ncbi:MAG: hypothetical protein WBD28_12625 [Candidatus Zixiibacteriota bacterium]